MTEGELFTSQDQVAYALRELKGQRGDSLMEGMLSNIVQQHDLEVAEKRRALDEAVAALPTKILDMKWSEFKQAGYPTTTEQLSGENQNPNGA